jgi:ketosteroid isomerase-like protein
MSEQQMEAVRCGIDAFNAGDAARFAEFATEDFEWLPGMPGAVGGGAYVGREGIDRYFREVAETWERLTLEPDELRAADDRVAMLGRAVGRGVGSGADVETPFGFVAEFRGNRIAKVIAYLDHGETLAAAGFVGPR